MVQNRPPIVSSPRTRILIIDDEVRTHRVVTLHLGDRSDIRAVTTGREGLRILRRFPADLVILESRLPDLPGLDVLAWIKARRPRCPVIIVTASGSEGLCAAALKLGARDYLVKPFDAAALLEAAERLLGLAGQRQAARDNVLISKRHEVRPISFPPDADGDCLRVQQAVQMIQRGYADTLSLGSVARGLGMRPRAASQAFRRVMKLSFREYVLQCRVAKARELLERSEHSVTAVAQMVGFGDLPRFDKVFKRHTAVPPSLYRRRHRGLSEKATFLTESY